MHKDLFGDFDRLQKMFSLETIETEYLPKSLLEIKEIIINILKKNGDEEDKKEAENKEREQY